MKELEIWYRVKASSPCNRIGQACGQLILPAIDPIGCLPYELAGLLPNREHNRDLMASIDHLPENRSGSQCVIGVFAADPFLNCKRIADHLIVRPLGPDATFQDVCIFAAKKEQQSHELYRDLAAQNVGEIRDLLEAMAKDELRHKNLVEAWYE